MRVAIIPARGGSKRIPRKNVKLFRGKPMIAWTIEAVLASKLFDKVIISTDDEQIAKISREHGAEVPFRRPAELADDDTPTMPVIRHAIEFIEQDTGNNVSEGCFIYATAPFVEPEDLENGYECLMADLELEFAFSATSFPFPIQRALRVTADGRSEMLHPENELVRSQDLEDRYHDAGQFYWFRRNAIFENDGVFSARSALVHIPRQRVQDIDTLEDWACAELAHSILYKDVEWRS